MREIPLSRGLVALVDDEDYERVSRLSWYAKPGHKTDYGCRIQRAGKSRNIIYLHRFIVDAESGLDVDHINGNGLDNRRSNLRVVTHSQNRQNQTRKRTGHTSRFKGVHWDTSKSRWRAMIRVSGRLIRLGYYGSETAARDAYASAAKVHFGEFAAPYVEAAE